MKPKTRRILTMTLLALGVMVLVFVGVVALQPSEFRIVRSTTISGAAPDVFVHVNDFHNWEEWSPWAKLDPAMKKTYEGAPSGTGAIYTWSGNQEVGEGRMTIFDSRPNERVQIKLEFLKPFAATNTAEFTLKPEGDHVVVTWSMFGKNTFLMKAFHLLMDMDKLVGGDFEKGLAHLKSIVEDAQGDDRK